MTVTTAKELMRVIAKHYEKCKGIYLHTMYNIPFKLIDGGTATLKGLPAIKIIVPPNEWDMRRMHNNG